MRNFFLLCLIFPFQLYAETSVWRVSKGDSELYLGGTIHMLSASDYPFPVEFQQAYERSHKLVLETDLVAMEQLAAQQELLRRLMYQPGKTLKDDLNQQTYQALANYSASIGLNMQTLVLFRPPMVMITLLLIELNRLGMNGIGVDKYFNQKALADGKSLGALESVQVQLTVIENMGKGHEDEMILNTLEEMRELPMIMTDMKDAWRKGDMQRLEEIGVTAMKSEFPDLFRLLLVDRNNAWLPKIEALLMTPEVELILVGALHLTTHEGLIMKLREQGYTVEYFNPQS